MRRTAIVTTTVLGLSGFLGLGSGAVVGSFDEQDGRQSAGGTTTASPSGPEPTGSQRSAATSASPSEDESLLYWADGEIHDGDTVVRYQPKGTVGSLVRVDGGWLSYDRFGSDGSRLVTIATDGTTTVLPGGSTPDFDVSGDGARVVYPSADLRSLTVVSLADASVVAAPQPPLGLVYRVAWQGEDTVIVNGATATESVVDRVNVYSAETDNLLQSTADTDMQVVDVSPDGSTMLVHVLVDGSACLRAYALDGMREIWSHCGVTRLSREPFSPDGASVLVGSTVEAGRAGPPSLEILNAVTGEVTGTIDSRDITSAEWSTAATVLVETEESASPLTHELQLCGVDGACRSAGSFGLVQPGVG
jgi:hypothetical protein